jgi:hypothetical protein
VKPGGAAFLIPVAIFVVGLVLLVLLIIGGVNQSKSIVDNFDRVDVGESEDFDLDAGGYRVWLEGDGVQNSVEGVDYTITDSDGDAVITSSFTAELSYDIGGHEATAFNTFDLDDDGQFTVSFNGVSSGRTDVNLAIGQDNPVSALFRGIVLGIVAAIVGFVVAVIVTIILFVKRSRSRRAQQPPRPQAPAYGYGYPPPQPQTQGYPPPGYPPSGPGFPPPGYPPPQDPSAYPPPQQQPRQQPQTPPGTGYAPPG